MPNHCSNYLEISVDPKDKKAVEQLANFTDNSVLLKEDYDAKVEDGAYFTFEGVLPMPEELKFTTSPTRIVSEKKRQEQLEKNKTSEYKSYPITKKMQKQLIDKYGYDNWYDWKYDHWGTKWDAYDCYISELLKDYFSVSFDTAWSPPFPYYLALSKKYPLLKIEIEYSEPGMDFAGRQSYYNGKFVDSIEMSCSKFEFLEDAPSWWDRFYDDLGDDCHETLEDFKEHYSDIWEIMSKADRVNIKEAFKQHENEKASTKS